MSARLLSISLVVCGCGRIGFDPLVPDDGIALTGCWPRWHDRSVRFSAPERINGLGSMIGDPSLSGSDKLLHYSSNLDIYVAMRADLTSPWGAPALVSVLNSAAEESRATFSADDLIAILSSDRNGGRGLVDLWISQRPNGMTSFPTPSQGLLGPVNDATNQYDPELSPDGLHLYFAPSFAQSQRIATATRTDIAAPFGPPVDLTAVNITGDVSDPTISPDELVIVVSVMTTQSDLYFATRISTSAAFSAPVLVPDVNTTSREADGELSSDGCELYFQSYRSTPQELYVARVL